MAETAKQTRDDQDQEQQGGESAVNPQADRASGDGAQAAAGNQARSQRPNPPTTGGGGGGGGAAPATGGGATAPANPNVYNKDTLLQAVTGHNAATAIRQASLNPTQAMADLGSNVNNFFAVVRAGKPYTAVMRTQLSTIFHGVNFDQQKKLFEAQFNVTIAGSGGTNFTQAELTTLYDQARLLPPNHVENNPSWLTLLRQNGAAEGSFGGTSINMGAQNNAARYSQVFRHEVGHAVDDRLGSRSQNLRINEAGWKEYGGIDAWITALGGYGTIPAGLQATVKAAAQAYLGRGGTFNSPTPTFEETLLNQIKAAHPGVAVARDGSDAVSKDLKALKDLYTTNMLLKACIASQGQCNYWRFTGWPEASGKVFFINHWYAKGYSLSSTTWNNLKSWNNSSAAFSDKEWFAEIYADWYQNGVGGAHTAFPGYVTDFFTNTVDKMGAGATAPPATTPGTGTGTGGGRGATPTSTAPQQGQGQGQGGETATPPLPGMEPGMGAGGHPKVPRG